MIKFVTICNFFLLGQGIKTTKIGPSGENPCPSEECWNYQNGRCKLKRDSHCFSLSCGSSQMHLRFKSKLFGIADDSIATGKNDDCIPRFYDGDWILDTSLGHCGMKISNFPDDRGRFVQFVIGVKTTTKSVVNPTNPWPVFSNSTFEKNLLFKCRYSSIVGVDNSNSDDFLPEVSHDEIVAKGSFIDSFRLDIFQNDKFRRPIGSDRILLGHMVYGQITWGISSLYNKLSFYVDQCTVTISDSTLKRPKKITMIKKNCYSNTVEAALLSPKHIVRRRSRFGFRSFSANRRSISALQTVSCKVKVCLIGKGSRCLPTPSDKFCPKVDGYNFTHTGYLE